MKIIGFSGNLCQNSAFQKEKQKELYSYNNVLENNKFHLLFAEPTGYISTSTESPKKQSIIFTSFSGDTNSHSSSVGIATTPLPQHYLRVNITNDKITVELDGIGGFFTIYYFIFEQTIIFSNTLSLLLEHFPHKRELSLKATFEFFSTGYILPPRTLIQSIYKLSPGTINSYDRYSGLNTEHYHSPKNYTVQDVEDITNNLREALSQQFPKNCFEDTSTAFLCSGGIDSSILLAIGAQKLKRPLTAATAAFPGTEQDESKFAAIVAKKLGFEHRLYNLRDISLHEALSNLAKTLNEPTSDDSIVPTFYLFNELSKDFECIVSGDGPDHLMGRYYPLLIKKYLYHKFKPFLSFGAKFSTQIANITSLGKLPLREAYTSLFQVPCWGEAEAWQQVANMLPEVKSSWQEEIISSYPGALLTSPETKGFKWSRSLGQLTQIDFAVDGSFGVFNKVGQIASALNVDIYEPYLREDVLEQLLSLPHNMKVQGTPLQFLRHQATAKWLLKKKIAPPLLPETILNKPKYGFIPPLHNWLNNYDRELPITKTIFETTEIFQRKSIESIYQRFQLGDGGASRLLFMSLLFCYWIQHNKISCTK